MGHACELRWVGDATRAQTLLDAIAADDASMFEAGIEHCGDDAALIITVRADSLRTLQALADDILACLAAAEAGLDALQ